MNVYSQLIKARIEQVASDLSETISGLLWHNTTSKKLKFYDGVAVKEVVDTDSAQTLTNKTLTSPAMTGTPVSPTAVRDTSTTQVASTEFVAVAISPKVPVLIASLDVDWASGDNFYKSISASTTFTFSNVAEGKTITLVITNTSGISVDITFPSGIFKTAGTLPIAAGQSALYSFVRIGSITYLAALSGLAVS